jgi:hypothetical protein
VLATLRAEVSVPPVALCTAGFLSYSTSRRDGFRQGRSSNLSVSRSGSFTNQAAKNDDSGSRSS